MSGRYPSQPELDSIADWKGTLRELIEFVQSIWQYEPPVLRVGRSSFNRKKCYKLEIHTWGWSGNEDLVVELHNTMLWFSFWRRSDRGGHYYFEIPEWALDSKKLKWGDPRNKKDRK